jgi:hypothetical protein
MTVKSSKKAVLEIRRNADGVIRKYPDLWDWPDDEELADYMWSEGNYACDCNRHLFFVFSGGEEDDDRPCGDGAYSVRLTDESGNTLYEDFSLYGAANAA